MCGHAVTTSFRTSSKVRMNASEGGIAVDLVFLMALLARDAQASPITGSHRMTVSSVQPSFKG